VLLSLGTLSCLNLKATPFARGFKNYKKHVIAGCANLKFLDDRPVQQAEHRLCEAFIKGGVELEKTEKGAIMKEGTKKKDMGGENG
jgi:hypothetical protein